MAGSRRCRCSWPAARAIRAHTMAAAASAQNDRGRASGDAGRMRAGRARRWRAALLAPAAPRLVAIGGLSGTGKSTLARRRAGAWRRAAAPWCCAATCCASAERAWRERERLGPDGYTPDDVDRSVYAAMIAHGRSGRRAPARRRSPTQCSRRPDERDGRSRRPRGRRRCRASPGSGSRAILACSSADCRAARRCLRCHRRRRAPAGSI